MLSSSSMKAVDTEDRRKRKIARYQPKRRRSHQRKSDEFKLLRTSLSDLLNVPDGWPPEPPDCEAVEHALLNMHERLVTLGTTGANAVGA
jgi:hypothetical protein